MVVKFFSAKELACKCARPECDAVAADPVLLDKIELLRAAYGKPMKVNSALRCVFWNTKIKGAKSSQHMLGKAIDISVPNATEMMRVFQLAFQLGFKGFGIAKTFIHLDVRDGETKLLFGY